MITARRILLICMLVAVGSLITRNALAWGDEGHKIVALIAEHYLDAAARARVSALLATDTDNLTAHDIASAATWADKYRDSDRNGAKERYTGTRQWHFVDIELADPDLGRACFGYPPLPAGTVASKGPRPGHRRSRPAA